MRRLGALLGGLTLLGAGGYVFVYLYRWEWNRALVALGFFLAAEIAVAAGILLRRLEVLGGGTDGRRGSAADPTILAALRQAPPQRTPFRWLGVHPERTSVFIPVLLGAGVVIAGLAWLIERLAGATARPSVDRVLAEELTAVGFPADGLVPDDVLLLAGGVDEEDEALRRLAGPSPSRS